MEQRLKDLKELAKVLDGKYDMPIRRYQVVEEIEKLEKAVDLKNYLEQCGTLERYAITKYFELGVGFRHDELHLSIHFRHEYVGVIYDYFIGSHSGMDEWAMEHVNDTYNFLTGNAPENFVFGNITFNRILESVTEIDDAEVINTQIHKIVDYWTSEEGKLIAKAIDNVVDVALEMFDNYE